MLWLTVVAAGKASWSSAEVERRSLVESLYEREATSLVRLARVFTDDRAGAEDIVQEAFIKFYYAADRINDPSKSTAYLRSIVLNLARDHNRRGLLSLRHQDALVDRRPVAGPDEYVTRNESQMEVLEALDNLSPRQRECLVLRFYLELSEREIAETLSISPNSVKTHCRRGMESLANQLEVAS